MNRIFFPWSKKLRTESGKTLLAVPSPNEWKVLYPKKPFGKTVDRPLTLSERFDVACLGIGLVGFGGNLVKLLVREKYSRVIVVGIAGALPGSGLTLADTVRVDEECVGDEGYIHSDSFKPYFRRPQIFRASPSRTAPLPIASLPGVRGVSVNTLVASSQILECRAKFFGAKVEAMEGASAFAIARAMDVEIFEIRTISNFTGDLDESKWNLRHSLRTLAKEILDPIIRGESA